MQFLIGLGPEKIDFKKFSKCSKNGEISQICGKITQFLIISDPIFMLKKAILDL
jgi:hypothetical protein